jgi:hypothetical protein
MTKQQIIDLEKVSLDNLIALDYYLANTGVLENISLYGLLNSKSNDRDSPYFFANSPLLYYNVMNLKPTQDGIVGKSLLLLNENPLLKIDSTTMKESGLSSSSIHKTIKSFDGKYIDLRNMPVVVVNNRSYTPKGPYLLVGHIRSRYALDHNEDARVRGFSLECVDDLIMENLTNNVNRIITQYAPKSSSVSVSCLPIL